MTAHGNNKPWSEGRVEKLKKLWTEGKSGSEIAAILGGDLSRAAVIGKANRLGLASRDTPVNFQTCTKTTYAFRKLQAPPVIRDRQPGAVNARKGRPPNPGPQNRPGAVFGKLDPVVDLATADKKKAAFAAAGNKINARFDAPANDDAIPLIDRRRFQCAWPVGAPARPADQLCCGQPVPADANVSVQSYCTRHAKVAVSRVLVGGKPDAKVYERSMRRFA